MNAGERRPGLRRLASLALALGVAPIAAAQEPPPEAVLADLPFLKVDEPNRIFVDLAPPGSSHALRLLLDTGATHSIFTPLAAREAGVRVRRLKRDPYRRKTALGRDLLFYVDASSSDTGSQTGWEYGLLGGNFLGDYVMEFDFEERRVRFLDPGRFEVPEEVDDPNEVVLPLEVTSQRPAAVFEVNGQRFPVLLDTGAPDPLILSGKLAQRAGIESAPRPGFRVWGVMGAMQSELGEVRRYGVGPFVFERVPVIVLPRGWYNQGLPEDAVTGYDLLSQFHVRIDYPRRRLWLRRRPDVAVTFQGKPWRGWEEFFAASSTGGAVPGEVAAAPPEPREPARPAGPAPTPEVWLELGEPEEGLERAGRLAWTEVRGWAGAGRPVQHDVVVAVDVSGSTAFASGVDVDGDGHVGRARRHIDRWRTFNPHHMSSDLDDTILSAELVATRRLLELLDLERTRVGLLSFADGPKVLAPVGSDEAAMLKALEQLERNFGSGATNLAAATETARDSLLAAGGKGRRQSILILSDGYPTAPAPEEHAAEQALRQADAAAQAGVRLFTFALGVDDEAAEEKADVYAQMASLSGGRYARLEQPGEILHELPRIDLAEVAGVEIANETTGENGRAVRVFPDGSFDGFVELAPGENILRVTARGEEGGAKSVRRRVFFEARGPRDDEEARVFAAEAERLREALRLRALETELAAEAGAGPAEQQRKLELEAESEKP